MSRPLNNFDGAPANDDLALMMVSLMVLRDKGVKVTSRDMADYWLKYVTGKCPPESPGGYSGAQ